MPTSKPAAKVKRGSYLATVPPQEILPIINSRYESSVKGIYVIGDVTGMPLVKVAANQGREVIEKMDKDRIVQATDGDGSDSEGLDVVIVGGGPAGISAGIEAAKRGWKMSFWNVPKSRVPSAAFRLARKFTPSRVRSHRIRSCRLAKTLARTNSCSS